MPCSVATAERTRAGRWRYSLRKRAFMCMSAGQGNGRGIAPRGAVPDDAGPEPPQETDAVTEVNDRERSRDRDRTAEPVRARDPSRAEQDAYTVERCDSECRAPCQRQERRRRGGRRQGADKGTRDQLAGGHDAAGLPRGERLESAVLIEHPRELAERAPCVVIAHHVPHQDNFPAPPHNGAV